jgi:hypothetical protein
MKTVDDMPTAAVIKITRKRRRQTRRWGELCVRMNADLLEAVRRAAALEGITPPELVRRRLADLTPVAAAQTRSKHQPAHMRRPRLQRSA